MPAAIFEARGKHIHLFLVSMATAFCLWSAGAVRAAPMKDMAGPESTPDYLPGGDATNVLTVATNAPATASIWVMTVGLATRETGPRETVKTFGEVYAFQPSTFWVHRDEPTVITFWNLQPDNHHNLILMDPEYDVLMKVLLPPLHKTSYVYTFHKEGLYRYYCTMNLPEMAGQILVLPPMNQGTSPDPAR